MAKEFVIFGEYRGKTEEIDTASTRKEVDFMLGEYRLAFGAEWKLWCTEREEEQ